jgi:hypothetical protein
MREPNSKDDFNELTSRILKFTPTTFIRFSDGELEVLRNNPLSINNGVVKWRLGTLNAKYPPHDNKSFVPERDHKLRSDLISSARYRARGFFKGVPTSSNKASLDRDYMIGLNGGSVENLTFSDLFINENYLRFLRETLPFLQESGRVAFLGNFRAQVSAVSPKWSHIKLQDNVFPIYEAVLPGLLENLGALRDGSIILSSASSLSNILGHKLHLLRPDISFIDVGTSLNPFVGLGQTSRAYQTQLLPWVPKHLASKLKYQLLGNHKMRW